MAQIRYRAPYLRTTPAAPTTALALATSTMTPGQSKLFKLGSNGGPDLAPFTDRHDIQQLTSNLYYDPIRKEVQVMGKPASSQSTNFTHFLYRESTNTWQKTLSFNFEVTAGHLWNHCFDRSRGEYYVACAAANRIWRFDRASWTPGTDSRPQWSPSASCEPSSLWGGNYPAGMAFHPNLFGPGDPGVVVRTVSNLVGWRRSTVSGGGTWQRITATTTNSGIGGGANHYWADIDECIVGTGEEATNGTRRMRRVRAGSGGNVNTTHEVSTTDTPIRICGQSGYAFQAHVVQDPTDPNTLICLDSGCRQLGTADKTQRFKSWWRSFDRGDTWVLQPGEHPFWTNHEEPYWTVGCLLEHGVLMALHTGETGGVGTRNCMLWKPPPSPTAVPQWFTDATANTWVSVAPDGVIPVRGDTLGITGGAGIDGVTDPWTGGCVDPVRKALLLPANGGHTDYSGNELYQLRLDQATPAWQRLDIPSPHAGGTNGNYTLLNYGDGTPRSMHSRNNPQYVLGKIWYPWTDGTYPNGFFGPSVWSYDREALGDIGFPSSLKPWTSHGVLFTASGNQNFEGSSSCYDPVTDRFWIVGNSGALTGGLSLFSFERSNPLGTYQAYPMGQLTSAGGGSSSFCLVATVANPRVLIHGGRNGAIAVANLSTGPTAPWVYPPMSGTSGLVKDAGAVYIPAQNAFYTYHDTFGANIRKCQIPADPINGTYVWSSITIGGLNPASTKNADSAGPHSKFNYIPDMGGGVGAFVVFLSHNKPTYVCKIGTI